MHIHILYGRSGGSGMSALIAFLGRKPTAPSELCNRLWPIHVSHLLATGMVGGQGMGRERPSYSGMNQHSSNSSNIQ